MVIQPTAFYNAFEAFVKAIKETEIPNREVLYNNLSRKSYINEYCTYKFGANRQAGHTCNSIAILPKYFENTCFVYYNSNMQKQVDMEYKWLKPLTCSLNGVKNHHLRGLRINCVCIDPASLFSKDEIEMIVNETMFDLNYKLILLE